MTGLRCGIILLVGAFLLPAQEFKDSERKISTFILPNGLRFVVMERHQAPIVSFHTLVLSGSAQDPSGQTGIAHMFEHLSFKGTESIGTKNWPAEKKAMDDAEAAYDRWDAEQRKGGGADPGRLGSLEIDMRRALDEAAALGDPNEYIRVLQENGAVNLAAHTGPDTIETSYSLPSNRIELWFLMESQRLKQPVFRGLYRERDNMISENQNNVDTKAIPKLQQSLLATAFAAHPYRNPTLGWPSDIANLRRSDAKAFFDTYLVPGNMIMGIVGDVDPANVQRLAERYFGSLPAKPLPGFIRTQEPPQLGPKTVVLVGEVQPMLMVGYKRPGQTQRDDLTFDVLRIILAEGKSGQLYKELVEDKRIAQQVDAIATFPAGRYINLFVFSVVPAKDHTVEENQKALDDILARFKTTLVDGETLERVKNIVRSRMLRILGNNQQLAALLPDYYATFGDWRKLFTTINELNQLTAEDVQRVAAQYFVPGGQTVAYISNGAAPSGSRGPQ